MSGAVVDHVTTITIDAPGTRGEALAAALATLGFSLRTERRRLVAESTVVEAQDAKQRLRALGFEDREYRIFLEYVRRWGIL